MATVTSTRTACRYHVFLSFRGDDTRNKFVGHLHKEMKNKGIYAFKDDVQLARGKSISHALVDAIEESRFSVVVISENYASSSYCLDELAKIIECRKTRGQIVVPIFYNVDPCDVEKQKGSLAKAFTEHEANFQKAIAKGEINFKDAAQKMQSWREVLTKVAAIAGWDSRHRDEVTLIETIVGDISNKLICSSSMDAGDLVGMGSRVKEMDRLLRVQPNDCRFIGIWGMAGVGKTTIARVIFHRNQRKFEASWFLNDVKRIYETNGVAALQKELLSNILREQNTTGWDFGRDSDVMRQRLGHRRVLIVLDDVNNKEQLEILAKEADCFGPGSRIIITTRDKQLLDNHKVHAIYEVKALENDDHALQLFSMQAFKQNQPKEDYLELSKEFVRYASGLPLALKVLGSSLYNMTMRFWQSELKKLQTLPNSAIQNGLEISFSGLDYTDKQAFLDIACFFNGENKDVVKNILHGCDFHPDRAFEVLENKAMITTSDNRVYVHKLLQEMGREIVRKESEQLAGERSRLWNPKDICYLLTRNAGTKKVEGIFLDMSKINEMQEIKCEAFTSMDKLRLLKFYTPPALEHTCNVNFNDRSLPSISDVLSYLHWSAYPFKKLPPNFSANKLVELNLPYGKVEQLWEGRQSLENLKAIDVSHSNLTEIPDLSDAIELERLNLQGCVNLVEVFSLQYLTMLHYLNLKGCKNLRSLPRMTGLNCLKTLHLSDCPNLGQPLRLPIHMKCWFFDQTAEKEPSSSFGNSTSESSPKILNVAGSLNLLKCLTGNRPREVIASNEQPSGSIQHVGSHCSISNYDELKEETGKKASEVIPMKRKDKQADLSCDFKESKSEDTVAAELEGKKDPVDLIGRERAEKHLKKFKTGKSSGFNFPSASLVTSSKYLQENTHKLVEICEGFDLNEKTENQPKGEVKQLDGAFEQSGVNQLNVESSQTTTRLTSPPSTKQEFYDMYGKIQLEIFEKSSCSDDEEDAAGVHPVSNPPATIPKFLPKINMDAKKVGNCSVETFTFQKAFLRVDIGNEIQKLLDGDDDEAKFQRTLATLDERKKIEEGKTKSRRKWDKSAKKYEELSTKLRDQETDKDRLMKTKKSLQEQLADVEIQLKTKQVELDETRKSLNDVGNIPKSQKQSFKNLKRPPKQMQSEIKDIKLTQSDVELVESHHKKLKMEPFLTNVEMEN